VVLPEVMEETHKTPRPTRAELGSELPCPSGHTRKVVFQDLTLGGTRKIWSRDILHLPLFSRGTLPVKRI
jgi:hypothetical protein